MRHTTLLAVIALLAMIGPASAALVIDFEQGSVTGGTISYQNSNTQATGTNIPVDILKVTNGATTTFYDLYGAGANSVNDTNGSALVNFNTATGAFTIVGGVCDVGSTACNGGANTLVTSTTLVNGTGASANIVTNLVGVSLALTEPDTKATSLLTALGIPTNTTFELMTAQFNNLQLQAGQTNAYTAGSVDIANVGVPEPTAIVLLGTLLVGITQLMRRRANKA